MKQVGDVVKLLSGGCLITVTAYNAKTQMVECCWIAEDGSPQDYTYPEGALDGPFQIRNSVVFPIV